jgi:predicted amidophosphoribosyltransferase
MECYFKPSFKTSRYCDGEGYCSRCGEAYRNYCLRCGLKLRKKPRNGRRENKKRIEIDY